MLIDIDSKPPHTRHALNSVVKFVNLEYTSLKTGFIGGIHFCGFSSQRHFSSLHFCTNYTL